MFCGWYETENGVSTVHVADPEVQTITDFVLHMQKTDADFGHTDHELYMFDEDISYKVYRIAMQIEKDKHNANR